MTVVATAEIVYRAIGGRAIQAEGEAAGKALDQLAAQSEKASATLASTAAKATPPMQQLGATATTTGRQIEAAGEKGAKGLKEVEGASQEANSGLADFATGAQAAIAALAVGQVIEFASELYNVGAAAERASNVLEAMSGSDADEFLRRVGEAAGGTVSDLELATAANRALSFGVVQNADDMARLTEVAAALGLTMGTTTTQAVNDLVTGISRMSAPILDNLGILVDMNTVNEEAAAIMSRNSLITLEQAQRQALLNAVLEQGDSVIERMGEGYTDSATAAEQLGASVDNLKAKLGELVASGLLPAVQGLNALVQVIGGELKSEIDAVASDSGFVDWFRQTNEEMIRSSSNVYEYQAALDALNLSQAQMRILNRAGVAGSGETLFDEQGFLDAQRAIDLQTESAERNEQAMRRQAIAAREAAAANADMGGSLRQASVDADYVREGIENVAQRLERYNEQIETFAQRQRDAMGAVADFQSSFTSMADVFNIGISGLDAFNLSNQELLQLERDLALATGQVTENQLAQQDAFLTVQGLYAEGSISAAEYADVLFRLGQGLDITTQSANAAASANNEAANAFLAAGGNLSSLGDFYNDQAGAAAGASESIDTIMSDMEELAGAIELLPAETQVDIITNLPDVVIPTFEDLLAVKADVLAPGDIELGSNAPAVIEEVNSVQNRINTLIGRIWTIRYQYENVGGDVPQVPGGGGSAGQNATGTPYWQGGMTWVGEQGAELMNLPAGTQIYPHGQSVNMANAMAGGSAVPIGGGGSQTITINNVVTLDGRIVYEGVEQIAKMEGKQFQRLGGG